MRNLPASVSTENDMLFRFWCEFSEKDKQRFLLEFARTVLNENPKRFADSELDREGNQSGYFFIECIWETSADHHIGLMRDYGDPFWECWGEPLGDVLLDPSQTDDNLGNELAEHYIEFCTAHDLPLPSDFTDSDGSENILSLDQEIFSSEFAKFVNEWRANVVGAIAQKINLP